MSLCCMQVDGGQLALYNAAYSTHDPSTHSARPGAAAGGISSTAGSDAPPPPGHLAGEPALLVAPTGGRLLVFDSRLPHEVLPAHRTRLSITAWFYRSKDGSSSTPVTAVEDSTNCTAVLGAVAGAAVHTAAGHSEPTPPSSPAAAVRAPPGPPATRPHVAVAACTAAASANIAALPAGSAATGSAAAGSGAAARLGCLQPRVFVSIAAFRDEECQWTLRDLFIKAAHPERVFVGVVWQIEPAADAGFARMAGGSKTAQYLSQVWWPQVAQLKLLAVVQDRPPIMAAP